MPARQSPISDAPDDLSQPGCMRILICDYGGYSFPVELSRALASRDHRVLHLYFADLKAPKGNLDARLNDPPNFRVTGITLGQPFNKRKYLRRMLLDRKFGDAAARSVASFQPDIVVGGNMPLDAQQRLQRAAHRTGAAFIFWMQDVVSQATFHYLGKQFGFAGRVIGRRYQRLEGALARSSQAVVAISAEFRTELERFRVPSDRVTVIPNWAPLSEIEMLPKNNCWSRRHGLATGLVALYTGTLKLMEKPELLIELAVEGKAAGLSVVAVAEGAGADWLARRKQEQRLDNLILLPYQPIADYSQVLATGDFMLATLDSDASPFTVPSKVLTYLAAGRPVVGSINSDNDAARCIQAAEAGFVSDPGRPRNFVAHALALTRSPELRLRYGSNARRYAETHFAITDIVEKFENVFSNAVVAREPARAGVAGIQLANQDTRKTTTQRHASASNRFTSS